MMMLLKKDIKSKTNIVFISSIYDDFDRNDKQLSKYIKCFEKIGITFNKSAVIDSRVNSVNAKKLISESDIVFLMGGSPELQMCFIKELNIYNDVLNCKIILGVSAGSMNQTKRVIYKDDYNDYKLVDYDGLNIFQYNFYPHFDLNDKQKLNEVIELSNYIKTFALPNESFIRIDDDSFDIVGNYYEYEGGEIINER